MTGWTVVKQSLNSTICGKILLLASEFHTSLITCPVLIYKASPYMRPDLSPRTHPKGPKCVGPSLKTGFINEVITVYSVYIRQSAGDYTLYLFFYIGFNFMFSSPQRLHVELNFFEWFVGFTDGDGCFSFSKQGTSFGFTFKLTQSVYNSRVLYFIKSQLLHGSITSDGPYLLQFRIRDQQVLKSVICPIFDLYLLHTSKYYSYSLFKQALSANPARAGRATKWRGRRGRDTSEERYALKALLKSIQTDYVSPHNNIPSKSWIIGFIEAEGSFYIVKKGLNRYVHAFGITQKRDKHILEQLKLILGISANIARAPLKGGAGGISGPMVLTGTLGN